MIDLQSDHVNKPTDEMWDAMRRTEPGWVIGRQDRSVNHLEEMAAEMMGKEAALFIPTGRMAVLVGLMTLCRRGHQVILERNSHVAWSQEWGLAYVCGAWPRLIEGRLGRMKPQDVAEAITESCFQHSPTTDLLCLENTHNTAGGTVLTVEQTKSLCDVAHQHGAQVLLDGARIFYAAAALGVRPADLVAETDAVTFNLEKGLSAPAGAFLCGTRSMLEEAYRNLSRIGGHSFHKAGILAAAGIVALEKMVDRLVDDIQRARAFAEKINEIPNIAVDLSATQSNIVMADISASGSTADEVLKYLRENGIIAHEYTPQIVRFTFHRHITDQDVTRVLDSLRKYFAEKNSAHQRGA